MDLNYKRAIKCISKVGLQYTMVDLHYKRVPTIEEYKRKVHFHCKKKIFFLIHAGTEKQCVCEGQIGRLFKIYRF